MPEKETGSSEGGGWRCWGAQAKRSLQTWKTETHSSCLALCKPQPGPDPGKAMFSQAFEKSLPVTFIKYNLFLLILIYSPIKKKASHCSSPANPETHLKSWPTGPRSTPEPVSRVFLLPALATPTFSTPGQ